MKNFKKIILGIGTLATVIAPIVTIISCGSNDEAAAKPTQTGGTTDGATDGKQQTGGNGTTDGKQQTGGNGVPGGSAITIPEEVPVSENDLIKAVQNEDIDWMLESIKNLDYEIVEGFFKTVTAEKTNVLFESLAKNVTDENGNTLPFIVKFIKALESSGDVEKQVYLDAISDVVKIIAAKSTVDGSTNNLKLMINLIKPLFSTDSNINIFNFIKTFLDSNIVKTLLGHMVDETDSNGNPVYEKDANGQDTTVVKQVQVGYSNFDDFVADLRKFLPDRILNLEYVMAGDPLDFDLLMEAFKTKEYLVDSVVGGIGKSVSYAANELITGGLKVGSVSNLLASIDSSGFFSLLKIFSPEFWDTINIIQELSKLDHPDLVVPSWASEKDAEFAQYLVDQFAVNGGKISTTIYNFIKNPLDSLTSDDFKNIIQVINSIAKTNISLEVGDAIFDVIHNVFDASLGSVSVILDSLKILMPSSSSMIDALETIIPTFLIGDVRVKSEEVDIKAELTKLRTQLTESTIEDGKVMPEGYDENTYSNLMDRLNEEAKQHIEDYDPMRARYALTKIEGIKVEMDNYNAAIDVLNAARVDFATDYGPSHEVVPMNVITAANPKHLDKAYEAISAKLVTLYNLDLDHSKLGDINDAKKQIGTLEGLIGEINLAINSLNSNAVFDTKPLLDKITALKIFVDGLSPIDKATFDTFELMFNQASDDKVEKGLLGHPVFSRKSEILGKFIDDNLLTLFGSEISPNFKLFTKLSFVDTFKEIGTQDYEILKNSGSDNGNVRDFVDNVIKKIISPEEFAKLQEALLDWLTY